MDIATLAISANIAGIVIGSMAMLRYLIREAT